MPRRIAIIGGGISGLAAAHRLVELSQKSGETIEILLLEASQRIGGVISSIAQHGFLLEGGPDSFLSEKPWGVDLCKRLGLEKELIGTDPNCRRSFVATGKKLLAVPEGFQLLAPARLWPFATSPIFSIGGKIRMACDLIIPRRKRNKGDDETLAEFVRRRLGQECLERIAQPMVAGIYAADPEKLSLQATMPRFIQMEEKHRSLILAMRAAIREQQKKASASRRGPIRRHWFKSDGRADLESGTPLARTDGAHGDPSASTRGLSGGRSESSSDSFPLTANGPRYGLFLSLKNGMESLVKTLASRLPEGSIRCGMPVAGLERGPAGLKWKIKIDGGGTFEVDAVCIALPAHHSARLVERFDEPLAADLKQIPYGASATMNLIYRRSDIQHPLNGFGFVCPAIEKRSLLACSFSSVKFAGRAPKGSVLLRAFISGELQPERETAVLKDLGELLGIAVPPQFVSVARHAGSMAHYHKGHLQRVRSIEEKLLRHASLALAGNAFRGIGIPDCIHSGELAAENILRQKL